MSVDHLPTLTSITALGERRAVLHLEGGSSVTVSAGQGFMALTGAEPFLLTTFEGEAAQHYRLPAHLHA